MTIQTPSLGDRSYLVTDGGVALVVDPQRDIDRVLALTASRGIAVTHIFETHIHNDYITGGLALARATGAAYHVNAADPVAFDRIPIVDGDVVQVGTSMRVRVIATPGHTFTHLAYALEDTATGEPVAVFTGGSLLHGSTGRLDLFGAEHTHALAAAQHASVRRLAADLPAQAAVWPAARVARRSATAGVYPVSDFADLAAVLRDQPVAVLDVRRRLERSGGHIEGALHVPLHRLPSRLPDLPPGPIWVHCQAGYRASVAASILHAAGHAVTAIDDDFSRAALTGLPLSNAPAAAVSRASAPISDRRHRVPSGALWEHFE